MRLNLNSFVFLKGNGYTIYHTMDLNLRADEEKAVSNRFWYGEWYKMEDPSGPR
jgi:hypothetical protein